MSTASARWDRSARALWSARGPGAALARGALLLPAAAYRIAVAIRNAAYDTGVLRSRPLPLPAVGVGNLAVGGAGKSPLARWIAVELGARGARVGLLLRGYGGDEVLEHREALPGVVVVADADRRRGALEAARAGADALVLDDCLQHRRVAPDLMLAVVAAESAAAPRWPLPAGPWREGRSALARADAVVVTRKSAGEAEARALAESLRRRTRRGLGLVAALTPTRLAPLAGGAARPLGEALAGRRVLAVCGIGAPEAFASQLRAAGAASVELAGFGDHHAYSDADVTAIRRMGGAHDLVVTTAKDAVKLRALWPSDPPACHVALLDVGLGPDRALLSGLLDEVLARSRPSTTRDW